MESLPKNVINKIMLYTSHPVVDILKASSIFKALEMNNGKRIEGSPFDCGDMDGYYARGYDPHMIIYPIDDWFGRRMFKLETDKEIKEYEASYLQTSDRRFGKTAFNQ